MVGVCGNAKLRRQVEIRTSADQDRAWIVEVRLALLLRTAQRIEQAVAAIDRYGTPAAREGEGAGGEVGAAGLRHGREAVGGADLVEAVEEEGVVGVVEDRQVPAGLDVGRGRHVVEVAVGAQQQGEAATRAYAELARELGLSPAQLALAWVNSRGFVTSNIIGATTLAQLEENLKSIDVPWDKDLEKALNAIHTRFPYPAP